MDTRSRHRSPAIRAAPVEPSWLQRRRFAEHCRSRASRLSQLATRIGYYAVTGADEAFTAPARVFRRDGAEPEVTVPIISGSEVRDWGVDRPACAFLPWSRRWGCRRYHELPAPSSSTMAIPNHASRTPRIWQQADHGRRANLVQLASDHVYPGAHPWSLVFPWVATHAHFAVLRGGAAPLQSAPVVRLPAGAADDDFFALAAALNSSLACFWLKQYSQSKGAPRADQLRAAEPWEHFYEFTSTRLNELPISARLPADRGRELDSLAQQLAAVEPTAVAADGVPTRKRLDAAHAEYVAYSRTDDRTAGRVGLGRLPPVRATHRQGSRRVGRGATVRSEYRSWASGF